MDLTVLPLLNACLNALASTCLVAGRVFIAQGRREAHKKAMGVALVLSVLFIVSYLIYHYHVGSVRFQGQGWIRTVYFSILLTHTTLAATLPLLIPITVYRAVKNQLAKHRRIARWTFPIWLYVSVTGVVVYLMLYQMPV